MLLFIVLKEIFYSGVKNLNNVDKADMSKDKEEVAADEDDDDLKQ